MACSRSLTARALEKQAIRLRSETERQHGELLHASRRIDALDAFARHAGGVLENMFVSYSLTPEKDELKKLVDQYHALFPSDQSLEF